MSGAPVLSPFSVSQVAALLRHWHYRLDGVSRNPWDSVAGGRRAYVPYESGSMLIESGQCKGAIVFVLSSASKAAGYQRLIFREYHTKPPPNRLHGNVLNGAVACPQLRAILSRY